MVAGPLFALVVWVAGSGRSGEETRASPTDSLKSIPAILLVIVGGGAFKQVLQDSHRRRHRLGRRRPGEGVVRNGPAQATKTQTVVRTLVGVFGLGMALLLSVFA
ncbi:hypothetical protein ABT317_39010 [Streptomyces carpinensis]|uniref:Integral membrane protein n=1 Tax=Streptomyces carpinensis TaxID=66369 RepID=A0ABV1WF26_9ACTN|nr:hypothetical protein [Streptomyces carpinensis]